MKKTIFYLIHLEKHPQLKKLMKSEGDPQMAFIGLTFVSLQFALALFNFHLPFVPIAIFLSMTAGSWLASGIFLQIHEACHGLTFGPNSVWKNRIYGFVINLPLGFPVFSFFKKHHKVHHKYQGEADLDVEYATESELKYFKGSLGKYTWIILNPYLQLWRAMVSKNKEKPPNFALEDYLNIFTIVAFDILLIVNGYGYMLFLLYVSNFTALATNIVGFWGISVHTEFFNMEETRNYCGWQNYFLLNFGYHVEHHDFPNIPGRYLPEVSVKCVKCRQQATTVA